MVTNNILQRLRGGKGLVFGLAALPLVAAITTNVALADYDFVPGGTQTTFTGVQTFPPANNSGGTFVVTDTPILGQIAVDAVIAPNTGPGSWYSEVVLRLTNGSATFDMRISPNGATGAPARATSYRGVGNSPAIVGNGSWSWQLYESFDDGGVAVYDADVTSLTIRMMGPLPQTGSTWAQEAFTTYNAPTTAVTILQTSEHLSSGFGNQTATHMWMEAKLAGTGTMGAGALTLSPAPATLNTTAQGAFAQDGLGNVGTTGAMRVNITNTTTVRDFLISPLIEVPASGSFEVRFDATRNASGGTGAGTWGADDQVIILASDADGATWTGAAGNRLLTLNNSTTIAAAPPGTTFSAPIPAGMLGSGRRFAIYAESTVAGGTNTDFIVDNFRVVQVVPFDVQATLTGPASGYQYRPTNQYTLTITQNGTSTTTDTGASVPLGASVYTPASINTTFIGTPVGTAATWNSGTNTIELPAQPINGGGQIVVTWQAALPLGSTTITGTVTDSSLGTPLSPSTTATGVINLTAATGSDAVYEFMDSFEPGGPTFSWRTPDASSTPFTSFTTDDDGEENVTPPFPIEVYGTPVSDLRVGANGQILVNDTTSAVDFLNAALNTLVAPRVPSLAPFWDDASQHSANSRWYVNGTAPTREFIIELEHDHYGTATGTLVNPMRYQVIFFEANKDIVFQYLDSVMGTNSGGVSATIGLRGPSAADNSRQYGFNNTPARIIDNMALRFRAKSTTVVSPVASSPEGNGGPTIVPVTITILNPPATPFSFDIRTVDGTATIADNDYVAVPLQTVNLPGGTASTVINVTINGDTAYEPDEVINFEFSNQTGGLDVGTFTAPALTIGNDDLPASPFFGVEYNLIDNYFLVNTADGTRSSLGASSGSVNLVGGDFLSDTGTFYGVDGANIYTLSPAFPVPGTLTTGPAITGAAPSHFVVSLSFNPADGQMWGLASDNSDGIGFQLGTLNLTTGAFTPVYTNTTLNGWQVLAHDANGVAYVKTVVDFSTFNERLYRWDPPSTMTLLGATGVNDGGYLGDIDFDPNTNTLYGIHRSDAAAATRLYQYNTTTGAATPVGTTYGATAIFGAFAWYGTLTPDLTVNAAFGSPSPAVGTSSNPYGTIVTASIPSPISIAPGEQQVVTGWTGTGSVPATGGTNNTGALTLRLDSSITWTFQQQYEVIISINPPASGTVSLADGFYNASSVQSITANPAMGFSFVNFTGDITSSANPSNVTVDSPKAITANFQVLTNVSDWMLSE